MYNQHTREMVTIRHRSLVERVRRKPRTVARDKGLAHTKKIEKNISEKF